MIRVTTDSDADGAGRLIGGRYRLDTRLGRGSMGTVWAATDELLYRPVAVKEMRLPEGLPEEEAAELRERALREARAIAALTHPNVVTLYDVAREEGQPFVVMELAPAQSLASILDDHGPLDDTQLALVADGVAAGLDAAHRAGIVHRDVKPGNVLIGDEERVKLTDFGIARSLNDSTITRTGTMLGTPAYIAPETAEGHGAAAAGDLWGLGATLYAAVRGAPPYDVEDDPLETVASVVRGPVPAPPREGPVGEVIAGLMVKDPGARMPLTEVRRRLQPLLPEPGAHPFAMLLDPDAPTVRLVRERARSATEDAERPERPEPGGGAASSSAADAPPSGASPDGGGGDAAPLAASPGAPPFPLTPQRPRRSRWRTAVLACSAVLVFAVAAAAGFAGTRAVAGVPVLPPSLSSNTVDRPPALGTLMPYSDNAKHTSAPAGGRFSLSVPEGWEVFHYEGREFAPNKTISFVSPDGTVELAVQRFGGLLATERSTTDYLRRLPELAGGSPQEFELLSDTAEPGGNAHQVRYTTTERGAGDERMRRSSIAEVLQRGDDLWIVRVTAPEHFAKTGRELFAAVLPGFRTAQ
ncbi:serine/threonine-protein kinase [Salinifilum ghardaiensis]